ncbi:PilZ domain-containing protein [Pseudobdellovibrio sp. HCB154]|uniref:PilZ domain-containing protein n=1 Tax=Pseudobdellovibrio sp. HCB154 TaxID=3386277 RepID=UPI0039170F47
MTNNQFKKVTRLEVDRILTHGVFQKCQLSLNFANSQKVIKVKLATIPEDKFKRIYILPQEVEDLKDKLCAFSFKIGTQMYFFKARIRFNQRGFYVEAPNDQTYVLARRKHIRFEAHPKFPIYCSVVVSNDGKAKVSGQLLNISTAGASLRLGEDQTIFKKGNPVHALIKPEQSAGFAVQGTVRYVKQKNGKPAEVGLEFAALDVMQTNKINSICEELSFYIFTR